MAGVQLFLCDKSEQEMEKSAYFVGTKTKSLLTIPADWEYSAGNTPYFNRYNLEQIKGMSERFRSKFSCKNSDYYWRSKKKKVPLTLCALTCENAVQKLTKPTKAQTISLPLHTLVFLGFIFQSYYEAYCCEKPVMCRNVLKVIYFDLGLTWRSWGSEAQTQEEVWVEEEGLAICFHYRFHQSAWGIHPWGETQKRS